ncbi:MAG: glycosyltransferase family 39 protein [Alphaproteobacteria bacterium]|nr:glycosyltransferase family 39 protein [Alphaproteobacteria bacterium]
MTGLVYRRHAEQWEATYAPAAFAVITAFTAMRLMFLGLNPLELYPDEAQYWYWAQEPALGYFSKPPLIAWIIAGTTALFGDSEAAIRLGAPLCHAASATFLFLLGRDIGGGRLGFWSALIYLTLPGVFVSSSIISTDVPLLTCWAAALWAFNRSLTAQNGTYAAATGIVIGIGLLAKYAMVFFFAGMALLLILRPSLWRKLLGPSSVIILALALLVAAPNLLWNLQHGFVTFAHTASNANLEGELFNPGELGEFWAAQAGVFGPLLLLILVLGTLSAPLHWRRANPEERASDKFLLAFALPVLLVISGQAFLSRANANWAVLAYVPATILVLSWSFRLLPRGVTALSLALHLVLGCAVMVFALSPAATDFADSFAKNRPIANAFKRMKGWEELAQIVPAFTSGKSYTALLSDNREDIAEFLYYGREWTTPIRMWNGGKPPEDHFELTRALKPEEAGLVLLLTQQQNPRAILKRFEDAKSLGSIEIPIGGGRTREFYLFELRALLGEVGTGSP